MNKEHERCLQERRDWRFIAGLVKPGDRVLDMGCGDGTFLTHLKKRGCNVLGVEISQEAVASCIANGVPVIQQNINERLDNFPDASFDLAVLSHTLQETARPDLLLSQIVRIGKRAAVSVINFGYWRCRLQVAFRGRMPKSSQMPFQWYDTPNIHFCTLKDFRELCAQLGIRILLECPNSFIIPLLGFSWCNFFVGSKVFVLEKEKDSVGRK